MNYVWIVEMLVDGEWDATVGIGLNKCDARCELHSWRVNNPNDKFRIVKYMVTK